MRFFVSCPRGTEGALRRELVGMRVYAPRGETGGVSFEGSFEQGMQVCLWSRVAMRVLLELGSGVFRVGDAQALYAAAKAIDWSWLLTPAQTFAVSAVASDNPEIRHSGFAALKVKDAVVDAIRDRTGTRPNVSVDDPDVSLFLHVRGDEGRLFADLAGAPLHRRGYRVAMTEAPLKENLAASVLALGNVATDKPFIDPMVGSGTFAIEQALIARNIAPGLRRTFGFERWPDQSKRPAWERIREDAQKAILPQAPAPILGRDISPDAIIAAKRNAAQAGVDRDITFETGDIGTLMPSGPEGTIVLNPPYGERLGPKDPNDSLKPLYEKAARTLLRLRAWRLVVLSGNPGFNHALGRKPRVSHKLWNGPLETRLLCYEP